MKEFAVMIKDVTSSGLHGANRLASNSLLEGLVFGARTGEMAATEALSTENDYRALPFEHKRNQKHGEELDVGDIRNAVKSLMWRLVGVQRDRERLEEATRDIRSYAKYVLPHLFNSTDGWELQNLLTVSHLMAEGALAREESRGVHSRVDFPKMDNSNWRQHLGYQYKPA